MSAETRPELLPPPARGRIYTEPVRPGISECAPSGRARLDGIARWLQDVAYNDVADVGMTLAAAWVLRTTHLSVRRFPRLAENLTARTFCSGLGTMWAERRTDLLSPGESEPLVRSAAIWVHLDWSGRPAPFTPEERAVWTDAALGRRVRARLHHPAPPAEADLDEWLFRAAETDVAGHVNNTAYWVPVEERLLAGAEPRALEATMEFRTSAQPGRMRLLSAADMLWIAGAEEVHASARVRTP